MIPIIKLREERWLGRNPVSLEELVDAGPATLEREDFAERLLETVADPMYEYELSQSVKLLRTLLKALERGKALAKTDAERYQRYQEMATYLRWQCFAVLPPAQAEPLFRSQVMFTFGSGIEMVEKVFRLSAHYSEQEADYQLYREAILRGLKANEERLGQLRIRVGGTVVAPAIRQWLADYDHFSSSSRAQRNLQRMVYLSQGSNVRTLTREEREQLRQVVKVYDFLKYQPFLSATVEPTGHTLPEERGVMAEAVGGEPSAKVSPSAPSPLPLPAVVSQAYRGSPEFAAAVSRERRALDAAGADFARVQREFFQAVHAGSAPKTVAILQRLVERRQLARLLIEDRKLRQFLQADWLKRYGQAAADQFAAAPTARQSVQMYLQYVLQELLGLAESDAARIGMQLGNLLRQHGHPELTALAYYDVKEKAFRWLM